MQQGQRHDALWNGDKGAGGISWADRSRMGPLRGVIDAGDIAGRRNAYMHTLHLQVLQRELKRVPPGTSFLDFGCGTGRFIAALSKRCKRLVAIDKERPMIEAAQIHAAGCTGVQFECCDPAKIRFPDGYFDFVLCSSVLCVTISDLVESILRELGRVTRSGGTIVLLEQVADARGLTLRRYADALASAGFDVVRAYPIRRASSRMTSLVGTKPWIPPSFFGALAALEIFITARQQPRSIARYVEYAIVGRRR